MLPSISPPAENDFRNKAGKWNLYSMSSLNKLLLKLQNTLYGRIGLRQERSQDPTTAWKISGQACQSGAGWKQKRWTIDYRFGKKRRPLLIHTLKIFPSVLSAQILQPRGTKVVLQTTTTIFPHASDHEQCRPVACILLKAVPFTAPTHDKDPACFKLQVTSATRGLRFMWYSPLDLHYHCFKQLNKE